SSDCRPRNSQPHCQRSSFAYTTKPNLNNHRPQRIGLPGQRRTPIPLMESFPPFRGMHKVTDPQRESTENSANFRYFRGVAVLLRTAAVSADVEKVKGYVVQAKGSGSRTSHSEWADDFRTPVSPFQL